MLPPAIVLWLLAVLRPTYADRRTDIARLGDFYSSIPLYRSGSGTNIFSVGIGSPEQQVNLTLSKSTTLLRGIAGKQGSSRENINVGLISATNVAFIAVVGENCQSCTEDAEFFNSGDSTTFDVSLLPV